MDAEKYNRSVGLLCPTCGIDKFEFEGSNEVVESARWDVRWLEYRFADKLDIQM